MGFKKKCQNCVLLVSVFIYSHQIFSTNVVLCPHMPQWVQTFCQRLHAVWHDGTPDLYLSGYAWHNRYMYSHEKIQSYNEVAWGGGLGKSIFDEKGNWHSLAAIAFLDSHTKWEPAAGYTYLKIFSLGTESLKLGAGFSALVTVRSDLNNGYPVPGVLPWASLFLGKMALSVTYIPGPRDKGNVLYVLSKISLDI